MSFLPGLQRIFTVIALGLAAGCGLVPRRTTVPIPTQIAKSPVLNPATTLVVFLPGRGDRMEDFARHGFIAELWKAGVNADVISVDAHLNYYRKRTILDRLKADVFEPARARGYRRVVVVGISLGGLGGLLCQRDLPGSADALVLLAPYLGKAPELFNAITQRGGPEAWAAQQPLKSGVIEQEIWAFLGQHHRDLPPTWLLWGESDPFRAGHRMLATLLPAERVETLPGGHDWQTWKQLWRDVCSASSVFAAEKLSATSGSSVSGGSVASRPEP